MNSPLSLPYDRYVAANTTIPIPKIQAYSLAGDNAINMPFLIVDYVHGCILEELRFPYGEEWNHSWIDVDGPTRRVYEQLADVYIQLRHQEFPKIGALGLPSDARSAIEVCHRPLWADIIFQADEGLDPVARFKEEWLRASSETGPFVLMHGELSKNNFIFDDDYNIVAVIDWEWSRVVPAQFLVPPTWLVSGSVWPLTRDQFFYNKEVALLHGVIRTQEQNFGPPLLSEEWADSGTFCHSLVVTALFRSEILYDVYWEFLSYSFLGLRDPLVRGSAETTEHNRIITQRLEAFMDSSKVSFLARKTQEQEDYIKEEMKYFDEVPVAPST